MNKKISIMLLSLLLLVSIVSASPDNRVEVVVLGMINHGPMQPTVNAIKEVTSKYGSRVNLKWLDLETEEGEKYSKQHDLTAHLNVIIDGKYRYKINGKNVTFQWFEGQEWTKKDLDAVISNTLDNRGNVVPVANPERDNRLDSLIIFGGMFAVIVAIMWFLIKKSKK